MASISIRRDQLPALRAVSHDELAALPREVLAALFHEHARWCDPCNFDKTCPCDWTDPARVVHACNCTDGWGARVRALVVSKAREDGVGRPWSAPDGLDQEMVDRVARLLGAGS